MLLKTLAKPSIRAGMVAYSDHSSRRTVSAGLAIFIKEVKAISKRDLTW
jgi:hypothetical protein